LSLSEVACLRARRGGRFESTVSNDCETRDASYSCLLRNCDTVRLWCKNNEWSFLM